MVFYNQLEGNNVQVSGYDLAGEARAPTYNSKMGFSSGESRTPLKILVPSSCSINQALKPISLIPLDRPLLRMSNLHLPRRSAAIGELPPSLSGWPSGLSWFRRPSDLREFGSNRLNGHNFFLKDLPSSQRYRSPPLPSYFYYFKFTTP